MLKRQKPVALPVEGTELIQNTMMDVGCCGIWTDWMSLCFHFLFIFHSLSLHTALHFVRVRRQNVRRQPVGLWIGIGMGLL